MLSNERLKTIVKYLLPLAILVWALYSTKLVIETRNLKFIVVYEIYLVYIAVVATLCRKNLFQPVAISMLLGFMAFGNNIPMFAHGYIGNGNISAELSGNIAAVFLVSQISFALGALVYYRRLSINRFLLNSKFKSQQVGLPSIICLVVFVAAAGAFRVRFNIGAAKEFASIPYAGYFHYALFDGLLLVCLWYVGQSLKRNFMLTLMAFIPIIGLLATQALLGWRGTIFRVFIALVVMFWFQRKQLFEPGRVRSFVWLFLIVVAGVFAIELGQSRRVDVMGGKDKYAGSVPEFIERVQMRTQGTTRLAIVIHHFGSLKVTNDWNIMDLMKRDQTASDFVDSVIHGIQHDRKHSVGASGPGTLYVYAGMAGVGIGFFLFGVFFNDVYQQIGFNQETHQINVLAVAFYAILINVLFASLSENFDIGVVKKLIAITCIAYVCKRFLFTSRKLKKSPQSYQTAPAGFLRPTSHE